MLGHASVSDATTESGTRRAFTLLDEPGHTEWRTVAVLRDRRESPAKQVALVVAQNLEQSGRTIAQFAGIFLGFGLSVVILGAALTRLLVTSTFAPLRQVEATAAAIADGNFSERLPGDTPNTEVGRLNRSLNTMLARIDRAFADRANTIYQMRRFVGDASHELRTPLVSVRGYAELYRMGALEDARRGRPGDGAHREGGDPHGRTGGGPARARPHRRGEDRRTSPRSTSCRSPTTPRSTRWPPIPTA